MASIPEEPLSNVSETASIHSPARSPSPNDSNDSQQSAQDPPSSPRPFISYTREQLLRLSYSPLVNPPPDMPELKNWFGENENLLKKDEIAPPTNTRDRRYRRDAEDGGESSSRPPFRTTLSQPSQMGNFKHQSLRPNDRDRDRDRDREQSERERERDHRDKEGQERLRHLSDKYDRDRLGLQSAGRARDRDAAPHLQSGNTRGAQQVPANASSRRAEPRESNKKKAGETSEDWRRGAEPPRSSRDDKHDSRTQDRERARSRARDSSKTRRDSSAPRRERDERRPDREDKRNGDNDADNDRHWRDDGKREERLAGRRGDRGRGTGRDDWDGSGDRRWTQADDKDGRYKRVGGRDRKGDDKDKDDRREREREKEKEPAWMDTYVPAENTSGILGGQSATGELDGIQAWKKELKEKELKGKENIPTADAPPPAEPAPSNAPAAAGGLDEIQVFKMLMKREEDKKRSESNGTVDPPAKSPPVDSPIPNTASDAQPKRVISPVASAAFSSEAAAPTVSPSSDSARAPSFQPPPGSRLLAFAKQKPPTGAQTPPGLQHTAIDHVASVHQIDGLRSLPPAFSNFDEQPRSLQGFEDARDRTSPSTLPPHHPHFIGNPIDLNHNGMAAPKGSRFAKFFDGKREIAMPNGSQAQGPLVSSSPIQNQNPRAEYNAMNSAPPTEHQRGIDDLFAMLNNSHQRTHLGPQVPVNTPPQYVNHNHNPNLIALQQMPGPLHQINNRYESLYDSRSEDRFVPDGMVPGLRPLPTRNRENLVHDSIDDNAHYNMARLGNQPSRNPDQVYASAVPPVFNQQGRQVPLLDPRHHQPQYRGGPSPGINLGGLGNGPQPQQRLPPGLANLGVRPPIEANQFMGMNIANANPAMNPGLQQQQQAFNGHNMPNLGFNGGQIRGPLPPLQNLGPQHPLNNVGQPSLDPRLATHHQLMGLGGSRVTGGFNQQQGNAGPPHLGLRPQQQQQQHQNMPPHMLPHLVPPHLQHQNHPTSTPQSNDLMAILMGGGHRE